eukprot:scaffold155256_cov38-Prasinocladus_malaysianus.AAC.1
MASLMMKTATSDKLGEEQASARRTSASTNTAAADRCCPHHQPRHENNKCQRQCQASDNAGNSSSAKCRFECLEVPTPPTYGSSAGEDEVHARLASFVREMETQRDYCLGYPANLDFDYSALSGLSRYLINNCGDPFEEGNYRFHSKSFEREVLSWFARLWGLDAVDRQPWGYVTNGGTEGNMFAAFLARELLGNDA